MGRLHQVVWAVSDAGGCNAREHASWVIIEAAKLDRAVQLGVGVVVL
jgi:hypothetical protein